MNQVMIKEEQKGIKKPRDYLEFTRKAEKREAWMFNKVGTNTKKKKSYFGVLKGIRSFTKEDELRSCLADKED